MNKKRITSVYMAFASGQGAHAESQGTTFREGGLEKKVNMEKEKKGIG